MAESVEAGDALKGAEADTRVVQSSARVPSVADRYQQEAGLDAASGCEFVDDRIRLVD